MERENKGLKRKLLKKSKSTHKYDTEEHLTLEENIIKLALYEWKVTIMGSFTKEGFKPYRGLEDAKCG